MRFGVVQATDAATGRVPGAALAAASARLRVRAAARATSITTSAAPVMPAPTQTGEV